MKNSNKPGKFAIIVSMVNKYNERLAKLLNNDAVYEERKFTFKLAGDNVLSTNTKGLTTINGISVGEQSFITLFTKYFEPIEDSEFKVNLLNFEKQVKNMELETHALINQTNPKQWLSDNL